MKNLVILFIAFLFLMSCTDDIETKQGIIKTEKINDSTFIYKVNNKKLGKSECFRKINGLLDGDYISYDSTGLIKQIRKYNKGKKEGVAQEFNSSGNKEKILFYDNDSIRLYVEINYLKKLKFVYKDWSDSSLMKELSITEPVDEYVYFGDSLKNRFYGVLEIHNGEIVREVSNFYRFLKVTDTITKSDLYTAQIDINKHYKHQEIIIVLNNDTIIEEIEINDSGVYNLNIKNHKLGLNKIRGIIRDFDSKEGRRYFEYPIYQNYYVE